METLSWLLSSLMFLVFIAALIVVGGLLVRGYLTTGSPTGALTGALFGPRPERRLEVLDQVSVDGRRRLMLIRRDDVEHLIMTGGPVDVVIETGIGQTASPQPAVRAPRESVQAAVQPAPPPSLATPPGLAVKKPVKPATTEGTAEAPVAVYSRPARNLGQAVGDT